MAEIIADIERDIRDCFYGIVGEMRADNDLYRIGHGYVAVVRDNCHVTFGLVHRIGMIYTTAVRTAASWQHVILRLDRRSQYRRQGAGCWGTGIGPVNRDEPVPPDSASSRNIINPKSQRLAFAEGGVCGPVTEMAYSASGGETDWISW